MRRKTLSKVDIEKRKQNHNNLLNPLTIYIATDSHVLDTVDGNPDAEGATNGFTRYFYTAGQKMQNFVDDVNNDQPDLVLFLGDMVENAYTNSLDLFVSKWNQITPTVQKEITIGNHDMAGGQSIVNTDMADMLGYGDHSIIAGSKYNYTFVLSNDRHSVKFIAMDTNMDIDGIHKPITPQIITNDTMDFVKDEMLNSEQTHIILYAHGGAPDIDRHFDPDSRERLKVMFEEVKTQRPELNLIYIAGHKHPTKVESYPNFSQYAETYIIPSIVNYEIGKYVVAKFDSNAGIVFEEKEVIYPYP